ncbi:hypothetical protein J5226_23580 [Lysobacter sp. K5869]|uniref:hypothetical protein n=1 Tax=Lysobacter sp. K5869 TaxID=2820808 RepID=UPI001C05F0A4|nr:hypothetical protein [Lysobacter sp. K5869]QWP76526.1 hypothetical protein J5226_23580 [Lysobacter sp. K5869]
MLQRQDIETAVELQTRSYALLRWLAQAVQRGFIGFDAAHAYARDPAAAEAWARRHHQELPPDARPPQADTAGFFRLFAGYLDNGHALVRDPGKRLYSPDAHCFCEMCSWFIDGPSLRARPPSTGDQRRADRQMRASLDELALECGRLLDEDEVGALMRRAELREALALHAYAETLLRRIRGGGSDAGVPLALWRRFARTPQGAPKRGFRLDADAILAAQTLLLQRLNEPAPPR